MGCRRCKSGKLELGPSRGVQSLTFNNHRSIGQRVSAFAIDRCGSNTCERAFANGTYPVPHGTYYRRTLNCSCSGSITCRFRSSGLRKPAESSRSILRLENDLALEEVTGYLNERDRYLFSLRRMGWSWQDIGKSLGVSANTVEIQFNRGVARARRRILGRTHSKSNRTPESGRPE